MVISFEIWYRSVPLRKPYGTNWYHVNRNHVPKITKKVPAPASALDDMPPRRRAILAAAFLVLMEQGYAGASTLEIATRAKVSKRELYAEFGNKAGILEALIATTPARMQVPLALPEPTHRTALAAILPQYGATA